MSDALKIFTDLWGQLDRLPVALLIAAVAVVLGVLAKRTEWFPNRFIPLSVVAFTSAFYCWLGDAQGIHQAHPRVILAFYGVLLGFVTWAAHRYLLKRLEKFLPDGFFPPGSFDTDTFAKKDSTPDNSTENKP